MWSHLHGGLGDAGDLVAVLLEVREVAADEDFRMAFGVEGAVHEHASALIRGHAEQLAERRSLHARGPQRDRRFDALAAGDDVSGLHIGDAQIGVDFDAEGPQLLLGFDGKVFGVGGQNVLFAFNEDHARGGRVNVAEIVPHETAGDVADGAGQLDAGGATADDDEIERRVGAGLQHFALGQLEGEQNAAADLDGILDGFQSGREGFPSVVAEVGVGGAGGQHEVVVGDFGSAAKTDAAALEIEGDGFVHEDFGIGVVAQDAADGRGDLGRRKNGQRHLIEERLKGKVIAAVDDGHVHR